MRKKRHSRDYYPTYKGHVKEKTRNRWLIVLFILMMVIVTVVSYVFYQYSSIEEAFESKLYTSELVPRQGVENQVTDSKPYTTLLVTMDNIYVEEAQVEEALWAKLYYVDPEQTKVQAINIPLNLVFENDGEEISLNTYSEGGLPSIKSNVEQLFEINIDYISAVRLQNIRDIIDPLESIQVYIPQEVTNSDIKTGQFNGREIVNLIDSALEFPILDQVKLHQAIYDSVISDVFQFENIFQLPGYLENGEYVFQTEIPFRKLVEIYHKDDYNLTNVDLDELLDIDYTQIDNRYTYVANLDEFKDIVSRMSNAIDELANKE